MSWAMSNGYELFSLQYSTYCFGSNNLAAAKAYGLSDGCTYSCGGAWWQTCGGSWANSLYRLYL